LRQRAVASSWMALWSSSCSHRRSSPVPGRPRPRCGQVLPAPCCRLGASARSIGCVAAACAHRVVRAGYRRRQRQRQPGPSRARSTAAASSSRPCSAASESTCAPVRALDRRSRRTQRRPRHARHHTAGRAVDDLPVAATCAVRSARSPHRTALATRAAVRACGRPAAGGSRRRGRTGRTPHRMQASVK